MNCTLMLRWWNFTCRFMLCWKDLTCTLLLHWCYVDVILHALWCYADEICKAWRCRKRSERIQDDSSSYVWSFTWRYNRKKSGQIGCQGQSRRKRWGEKKRGTENSLQHPFSKPTSAEYWPQNLNNQWIMSYRNVGKTDHSCSKTKQQNHDATKVLSALMKNQWNEKHQKPRGCYWRRNLTALIPDDLVSVAFACHLQLCLWVGWWWKGAWWSAHLNSRAQRAQLNSLESRGGPWFLMTFVCQLLIAWTLEALRLQWQWEGSFQILCCQLGALWMPSVRCSVSQCFVCCSCEIWRWNGQGWGSYSYWFLKNKQWQVSWLNHRMARWQKQIKKRHYQFCRGH